MATPRLSRLQIKALTEQVREIRNMAQARAAKAEKQVKEPRSVAQARRLVKRYDRAKSRRQSAVNTRLYKAVHATLAAFPFDTVDYAQQRVHALRRKLLG